MPNWCENRLTVRGDKIELEKFMERAERIEDKNKEALTLNNFVKRDEENWYQDSLDKWGTKWEISGAVLQSSANELIYQFDSAWSPPTEWLTSVIEMYPTLEFELRYREDGCCFAGIITGSNGLVNSDVYIDTTDVFTDVQDELGDDEMYSDRFYDLIDSKIDELVESAVANA